MTWVASLAVLVFVPALPATMFFLMWRVTAWVMPSTATGWFLTRQAAGAGFGLMTGMLIAAGFAMCFGFPDVTHPNRLNSLALSFGIVTPTIMSFVLYEDNYVKRLPLLGGLYLACIPLSLATTAGAVDNYATLAPGSGIRLTRSIEGAHLIFEQAKAKNNQPIKENS